MTWDAWNKELTEWDAQWQQELSVIQVEFLVRGLLLVTTLALAENNARRDDFRFALSIRIEKVRARMGEAWVTSRLSLFKLHSSLLV